MLEQPDLGTRDRIIAGLGGGGIEARPIWTPIHRTQLYADAARLGGKTAESIFGGAFCLPSSSSLIDEERARVVGCLRAVAGEVLG
jgi:pyridoxal phosphate-dependent aminotransferase EpsN